MADFFGPPLDPSILLFDDRWRAALARYAPALLLTLAARSAQHYRSNAMALGLLYLDAHRRRLDIERGRIEFGYAIPRLPHG